MADGVVQVTGDPRPLLGCCPRSMRSRWRRTRSPATSVSVQTSTPKSIAVVGTVCSPIPAEATCAVSSPPTIASVLRFTPELVAAKRNSAIVGPIGGPTG
jgi:hypothetical protein